MKSPLRGSLFIVLSAFFYATYGIWSKIMVGHFTEFNQAWTRGLIVTAFLLIFGFITKSFHAIKKQDLVWFFLISLCGGLNQAPYFFGFEHLNIGTATLLFYVSLTLSSFIFGSLFFREKITPIKFISLITASVGLFIIYRFSLTTSQIIPAIATMVAGLMGSTFVIFTKKLSGNYSEIQILSGAFIVMLFANLLISTFLKEPALSLTLSVPWLAQLAYCAAIVIANLAVVVGFKHLEPSVGGLLGLLEVLFAVIFGIILFKEIMGIQTIIGGVLILLGASLPDLHAIFSTKNAHANY